jgi:hypothetical protein
MKGYPTVIYLSEDKSKWQTVRSEAEEIALLESINPKGIEVAPTVEVKEAMPETQPVSAVFNVAESATSEALPVGVSDVKTLNTEASTKTAGKQKKSK